jgi:hypothetical protein
VPQLLLLRTSHTRTVNSLTIENEPAAVLSAISGSQWLQLFSINSQAFLNDFLCSQFSAFSAFSASSFSVVVTTTTVAVTARATPGLDATLLRSVSPGAWSGWTLAQPVGEGEDLLKPAAGHGASRRMADARAPRGSLLAPVALPSILTPNSTAPRDFRRAQPRF